MLRELFQAIGSQAVQASAPVAAAYDPTKAVYYKDPKGDLKEFGSHVQFRNHFVATLDDLAQFAHDHIKPTENQRGSIFYSRDCAHLLIDDGDRRDSVTVSLIRSPQFNFLAGLSKSIEQKELIRALRTVLYGCFSPELKLVEGLRNLKWGEQQDRGSDIQRGKSSVGQSIMRQMTGLESLPEYIDFAVPVFASKVDFSVTIKCVFDPDEDTKRIILEPLPGQIETALFRAEEEIGRRLAIALQTGEDGSGPCFLYHGSP